MTLSTPDERQRAAEIVSRLVDRGLSYRTACSTAREVIRQQRSYGIDADLMDRVEAPADLMDRAEALGLDVDPSNFDHTALTDRIADGPCDGMGTVISSRPREGYYPCSGCSACDGAIDRYCMREV